MRCAVVFDFDDTLAHDSTSEFLLGQGIELSSFWAGHAQRLKEGWDQVPSYMQLMLDESRSRPAGQRFTRNMLRESGAKLQLFDGVDGFFSRLRANTLAHHPDLELELYVISSGIEEILRGSSVWSELKDGWAGAFDYNEAGEICAVKRVVSFTDKTRFLYQISKGLVGDKARETPFAVNSKTDNFRIRFKDMIFVGDGFTDIPCFALLQKYGGVPIAVFNRECRDNWGKAATFRDEKRVDHLVAADFTPKSGLDDILQLEIRKIAERGDASQFAASS